MDKKFQVGMEFNYNPHGSTVSEDVWTKRYIEKIDEWFGLKGLKRYRGLKPFRADLSSFKVEGERQEFDLTGLLGGLGEVWGNNLVEVFHDKGIIKLQVSKHAEHFVVNTTILSANMEDQKAMAADIREAFKPYVVEDAALSAVFYWYYMREGTVDCSVYFEQLNNVLHPEAYPYIPDMENYIKDYLDSPEKVLLLIGPPGTGKTKMIRKILKSMAERSNDNIGVYFTADREVLESSKMFSSFMDRNNGVMVLEDIDGELKERKSGNVFMYKMLATSDGILENSNKKIILSTNLPSVSAVDEALLRPGRCYDILQTRNLTADEASALLAKLSANAFQDTRLNKREYSLAEVYRMASTNKSRFGSDVSKFRKPGFAAEAATA